MNLSSLLLPEGEFRVIRCDIADKLIACGDGDSALLYLYALRHGDGADEKTVMRTLGFTKERFDRAVFTLTGLIVRENAASSTSVAASKPKMPKYTPNELRQARESDHKFAAVCKAAEEATGSSLSESRVRSLFGIYDYLGLPAEVIIELVSYLKRDRGKLTKYDIEREAYLWSDMGIYTYQQAQDYLARAEAMKPLINAIYAILQIVGREPSLQERNFAADCVKKGFPPEAVELACKRMEQHIGRHSLAYLQKILGQWDEKGVHTVAEITALEPESAYKQPAAPTVQPDKLEDWEQQWLAEVEQRKRSLAKEDDAVQAQPSASDTAAPLPPGTSATPPDKLENWEQQWLAEAEQRKRSLAKEDDAVQAQPSASDTAAPLPPGTSATPPDKLENWEQKWLAEAEQRKRSLAKEDDAVQAQPSASDTAAPLPPGTSATPPDKLENWEQKWLAEMEQRKHSLAKED